MSTRGTKRTAAASPSTTSPRPKKTRKTKSTSIPNSLNDNDLILSSSHWLSAHKLTSLDTSSISTRAPRHKVPPTLQAYCIRVFAANFRTWARDRESYAVVVETLGLLSEALRLRVWERLCVVCPELMSMKAISTSFLNQPTLHLPGHLLPIIETATTLSSLIVPNPTIITSVKLTNALKVTDEAVGRWLKPFKGLEKVNLSGTINIGPKTLSALLPLGAKLTTLNLSSTPIHPSHLLSLLPSMPNLEVLKLLNCRNLDDDKLWKKALILGNDSVAGKGKGKDKGKHKGLRAGDEIVGWPGLKTLYEEGYWLRCVEEDLLPEEEGGAAGIRLRNLKTYKTDALLIPDPIQALILGLHRSLPYLPPLENIQIPQSIESYATALHAKQALLHQRRDAKEVVQIGLLDESEPGNGAGGMKKIISPIEIGLSNQFHHTYLLLLENKHSLERLHFPYNPYTRTLIGNGLETLFRAIEPCGGLRRLSVEVVVPGMTGVGRTEEFGEIFERILPRLEHFELRRAPSSAPIPISLAWSGSIPCLKLKTLILGDLQVTSEWVEGIRCCGGLEYLDVSKSLLTDIDLFRIIVACPYLNTINLSQCRGVKVANRRNIFAAYERWKGGEKLD